MPAIADVTRSRIIATLEVFVENLVEDYRGRAVQSMKSPEDFLLKSDKNGGLKPFHAALIPAEVLRISAFERGLVTRLGTSLEECAKLIALDHHQEARRGYLLKGAISSVALAEIERLVALFEHVSARGSEHPALGSMIDCVVRANKKGSMTNRDKKVDLYVLGHNGEEYYFEMKTVKPNKDQCLRITQSILQVHALCDGGRPQVKSYLALPYNPYGKSRDEYKWTYPKNYMPFDDAVLIGHEFWSIIGGETCYEELLELYQYVGTVKGKYIVDSLAFGL